MSNRKSVFWAGAGILTISLLSLLSLNAYAMPLVKDIQIPAKYGTIKETFDSTDNTKPRIILIQDAHCNYEAQKNLAQILEQLIQQYNLRLILVEGGSGDVSLSFLREYADKKVREEVADKYLKQGKISGEEYLDIISDYNLELFGIEDEGLYDAHLAMFFKVDSIKEESARYLESLSAVIMKLKPRIYNSELIELEQKKKGYEDKTVTLVEYCRHLKAMAEKKGLTSGDYPHISAFSETAILEKEIDFKQAEAERNTFIKDLAGFLDEAAIKELISKSQDFKTAKLTANEYYLFLKTQAGEKIDVAQKYPQLNSYIRYISVSKDVNAGDLLKEVTVIEEKIKENCFSSVDERRLSEIDKALDILKGIMNLELTPEDYAYFEANRHKFVTASWVKFMGDNCRKYNLAETVEPSTIIDDNLFKLNEFYKLGSEREEAFIKNIAGKLNDSGEKIAVLITGGFHTPGLTQKLKNEGYSYAVATPVITQKGDSSIYFSILKGENKALSKADYIEDEE